MRIAVLDHGYVEVIEAWGGGREGQVDYNEFEAGIIEAARQSTQGSFRGWDKDGKLLKYLFDSNPPHATPFEFAGMAIEIQAPIFVLREWHRHRTQSYNEMSARYAPLPDLYYLPTAERFNVVLDNQNTSNKQAQGTAPVTREALNRWWDTLDAFYKLAEANYKTALAEGIPKELARLSMPVGHYTRQRASANLRNWLGFLTLRQSPHAQWEIRQYADAVGQCIRAYFPQTWKLFRPEDNIE